MIGGTMSVPITANINSSNQERFFPCRGWEPNNLIRPAGVVASPRSMPVFVSARDLAVNPVSASLFLDKILVQQFLPFDVVRFVIRIKAVIEPLDAGWKRMRRLDIAARHTVAEGRAHLLLRLGQSEVKHESSRVGIGGLSSKG